MEKNKLKKLFLKEGKPLRFNFKSACSKWDWAKRSDVYTHQIHNYPAKVLAYIPIYFLSTAEFCPKEESILDCFAGSGTILLESLVNENIKRNCYGIEINPLAKLIAQVKINPLKTDKIKEEKINLFKRISKYKDHIKIQRFKNIDLWFSKKAQIELTKIRNAISGIREDDIKNFFLMCFSSIIRESSLADPFIPPPVILKIKKNMKNKKRIRMLMEEKKNPLVLDYFEGSIEKNLKRIIKLSTIKSLKEGEVKGKMILTDARNIENISELKKESLGMIITSPPYISAQKYVRTTKLEMFWLNMLNEEGIKDLDRNNVGTEKVYKEELIEKVPYYLEKEIKFIMKKDLKRAQIVLRYFEDMKKVIGKMYPLLKNNRYFILILGNNKIFGRTIKNHEILSKIAEEVGFKIEFILVDKIRSRSMITKRNKSAGIIKDEYILVFKKN